MKRQFRLTIELENDSFSSDPHLECSHLLMQLAEKINMDGFLQAGSETDYGAACGIWDSNGNWTGSWRAILAEVDEDPHRWEHLSPGEIDALRTAINLRLCQMHAGGRECDCQEEAESKRLAIIDRQLNLEIQRRNG